MKDYRNSVEDTESINVTTLVTEEVTSSGSFDVTQFRLTSFGKLLQAFPVPALLIDDSHRIVFANHASAKIPCGRRDPIEAPVSAILSDPGSLKIVKSLLSEVLFTRKPNGCEAILGTEKARMWGRLFFRSVRLEKQRLILLVVEDLTPEKLQLAASQQHQEALQKEIAERRKAEEALGAAYKELEDRIFKRTMELMKLNEKLQQEIGERERAQQLLSESQQRLELALKGANLGSWDYDVHGMRIFLDKACADLFGYSQDDVDSDLDSWARVLHPEDKAGVIDAWNGHLEGRTPFFESEHRVKAKWGGWIWVLSRGKVVARDNEGKPLRVSGTAYNITARKQAEEKLLQMSKVFMDSIDPIIIRDLEGNIVDLNSAAEETYGWTRDELIGKPIRTIVSPSRHELVDELHERCRRGEKVENIEAIHEKKSGLAIPVLLSLSLLTNDKGAPVGIASITKDLTDLKRTEEMLRAKTEALERSNKDLEEFAYVAAHDLREPLVGIAAYLKVLQQRCRDSLSAEAGKFVSRALDITLRMDGLIQSLLAYSRLGTEQENPEPTDIKIVLDRVLSNLVTSIEGSGAKIIRDKLPVVMGNQSQLVQLVQNLFSNAIKFAADRPLEIHIGATRQGPHWQLFIRDNGIGIEPPYFDRIFRIFQRIETNRDSHGTGIGLANCKKIVERHGGRIWVESEPGIGSTFFFTLPAVTDSLE